MTAAVNTAGLTSRLVNRMLGIKPLANLAKHQARQMMIKRAEKIGVPWTKKYKRCAHVIGKLRVCKTLSWTTQTTTAVHSTPMKRQPPQWEAALEVEVAIRRPCKFGPMLERKETPNFARVSITSY